MDMMGPNGMMMRPGMQRPPMGAMMGMMGGHHPQMQHPMVGSRPPPPEYGMTAQVRNSLLFFAGPDPAP
jgi:hypothetical protein